MRTRTNARLPVGRRLHQHRRRTEYSQRGATNVCAHAQMCAYLLVGGSTSIDGAQSAHTIRTHAQNKRAKHTRTQMRAYLLTGGSTSIDGAQSAHTHKRAHKKRRASPFGYLCIGGVYEHARTQKTARIALWLSVHRRGLSARPQNVRLFADRHRRHQLSISTPQLAPHKIATNIVGNPAKSNN